MTPEELKVLKREARKKGTPTARLLELAALMPELAREVAKSEHTPPELLSYLSESSDRATVEKVATNPHTPPSVLETLSLRDAVLAKRVAHNKSASENTLSRLATHKSDQIREAVSYNPSTPLHSLLKLREDPNPEVSDHLLLNTMSVLHLYGQGRNVPNHLLLKAMILTDLITPEAALRLAEHPNPEVRAVLLKNVDKISLSVRAQFRKGATHDPLK